MGKRVLIYRIGQLGDTLIAFPALQAIRKHFPEAYLGLMTDEHPSKGYVSIRDLLPEGLIFDEIISYEAGLGRTTPANIVRTLWRLRAARFDTLVYLAPRGRTRLQVLRDLAFFRMAGIRHFIGHRALAPFPRSAPGEPLPFVEHEADHLLSRLAFAGIPVPLPEERRIDLRLREEERRAARTWLAVQFGADHLDKLVGVGPGAKWPSKIWPEERYIRLIRTLVDQFGICPVVFGGPELCTLGERMVKAWGCGANAAGQLSVRQAAATLGLCKLFVGNDTGTMHLAAAMNTPCVGIFAAIDWPGRWYPYGRAHQVLRRSIPCEGCYLYECTEHDMECLKRITVSEVVAACRAVLREPGV